MSQYKTGQVNVALGSSEVVGTNTLWLTNVEIGDMFTVVDDEVIYTVSAIDSDVDIKLSAPYEGTTANNVNYTIVRDFTNNISLPTPTKGDIETSAVIERAFAIIDAQLGVIGPQGTYLGLTDTPASYSTKSNEFCRVKTDETGLEFGPLVSSDIDDLYPLLAQDTAPWDGEVPYSFIGNDGTGLMRNSNDGTLTLLSADAAGVSIQVNGPNLGATLAGFSEDGVFVGLNIETRRVVTSVRGTAVKIVSAAKTVGGANGDRDIEIFAGGADDDNVGGAITIIGGGNVDNTGHTGGGGDVTIEGGYGGIAETANGGSVSIEGGFSGGDGSATAAGNGGDVSLTGGDVRYQSDGDGGGIYLETGKGAADAEGNGGLLSFKTGDAAIYGSGDGHGGDITFEAGDSGSTLGGTGNGLGVGGHISFTAGRSTEDGNAGNITLSPGLALDAGLDGEIYITDAGGVNIFKFANQKMTAQTPGYNTLIVDDDDMVNKKYVDDATSAGGFGEQNTSSNAGGDEGLALAKVGVDLPFKGITAGTYITLTATATDITIDCDPDDGVF